MLKQQECGLVAVSPALRRDQCCMRKHGPPALQRRARTGSRGCPWHRTTGGENNGDRAPTLHQRAVRAPAAARGRADFCGRRHTALRPLSPHPSSPTHMHTYTPQQRRQAGPALPPQPLHLDDGAARAHARAPQALPRRALLLDPRLPARCAARCVRERRCCCMGTGGAGDQRGGRSSRKSSGRRRKSSSRRRTSRARQPTGRGGRRARVSVMLAPRDKPPRSFPITITSMTSTTSTTHRPAQVPGRARVPLVLRLLARDQVRRAHDAVSGALGAAVVVGGKSRSGVRRRRRGGEREGGLSASIQQQQAAFACVGADGRANLAITPPHPYQHTPNTHQNTHQKHTSNATAAAARSASSARGSTTTRSSTASTRSRCRAASA